MPPQNKKAITKPPSVQGPVKIDTPLYRLLELLAQEVADRLRQENTQKKPGDAGAARRRKT